VCEKLPFPLLINFLRQLIVFLCRHHLLSVVSLHMGMVNVIKTFVNKKFKNFFPWFNFLYFLLISRRAQRLEHLAALICLEFFTITGDNRLFFTFTRDFRQIFLQGAPRDCRPWSQLSLPLSPFQLPSPSFVCLIQSWCQINRGGVTPRPKECCLNHDGRGNPSPTGRPEILQG
jgi:hypothetical protein